MQTHEYEVQGNYDGIAGWELLTTEPTRREANERLVEYHNNAPGPRYRVRAVPTHDYVNAWACRAADHVNGVQSRRHPGFGNLDDFRAEFRVSARTWAAAYRHLCELLKEAGQ